MSQCYYLVINFLDRDYHDASSIRIGYGVWADKADAEAKAAELNQRFKKEWDDRCREKREAFAQWQKRWDALKVAGLSEGGRPVLWDGYNAEWEPGIGGTEYYTVEEAEFFEANKEA